MECFAYVIAQHCANPKVEKVFCKIGISGAPEARLAQMQTGCPFRLVMQAKFLLPSRSFTMRVEAHFHAVNKPWAAMGEWSHAIPAAAADELATYCVEAWIEDGLTALDIAALCDRAGVSVSVFASCVADFISHPTLGGF